MKETYSHPGTVAPIRQYTCLNCGRHETVKGQWNIYAGRWLMSFGCPNCEVHQEAFVSEPRRTDETKVEQRSRADLD